MNNIKKKRLVPVENQEGYVLVLALMMLVILSVIGISALNITDIELQIAGNERQEKQIFYGSESGCMRGGQWLRNLQTQVIDEYADEDLMEDYIDAQEFKAALGIHIVTDTTNPESNLGKGDLAVKYLYDIAETIESGTGERMDCMPIPGNNPNMLACYYDVNCSTTPASGGARKIDIRVNKPTDFSE